MSVATNVVSCYKRKSSLKGHDVLLPGTGKKPTTCDGWYAPKFCSDCGKPVLRKGNCKKATCPDCATTWRFNRTKNIVLRLWSFKLEKSKRIRHFTLSPSDRLVEALESGKIGWDFLYREAYKTVRWKSPQGDFGGLIIPHPYRLTDEGKRKAKELKRELEDIAPGECGDWKAILKLDSWRSYCYFSPHFHILATVSKGRSWKEASDFDGGWVWKGIREISDSQGLLRTSMYLLSHAGILDDKHGIRWFGDVSTNNWCFDMASDVVRDKVEADFGIYVREYEEAENISVETCSECGGELVDFDRVPDYLGGLSVWDEDEKMLFAVYLFQSSGKDPPCDLETEGDFTDWIKSEYSEIFSDDSIFDGVSPSGLRRMVVSMPEDVKRKEKLRRKFWTDPQKVLEHFEKKPHPKYYGDDPSVGVME